VFKRGLDLVVSSLIELGQGLLKLDGVGFDAICIGFVVLGLHQLRSRLYIITDSRVSMRD
jgi:hypothetical protein